MRLNAHAAASSAVFFSAVGAKKANEKNAYEFVEETFIKAMEGFYSSEHMRLHDSYSSLKQKYKESLERLQAYILEQIKLKSRNDPSFDLETYKEVASAVHRLSSHVWRADISNSDVEAFNVLAGKIEVQKELTGLYSGIMTMAIGIALGFALGTFVGALTGGFLGWLLAVSFAYILGAALGAVIGMGGGFTTALVLDSLEEKEDPYGVMLVQELASYAEDLKNNRQTYPEPSAPVPNQRHSAPPRYSSLPPAYGLNYTPADPSDDNSFSHS